MAFRFMEKGRVKILLKCQFSVALTTIQIALKHLFFSYLLATITIGFAPATVYAQNGVWDSPKQVTKKVSNKVDKGKFTIKKWQEHIKECAREDEYNHQLALGGKLNSNGWSGSVYYLKKTDPGKHTVWLLSFSEIKHEKQVKQVKENKAYPELGKADPFVFGKINNLYALQLGYGREVLLLPGIMEGNLSVSFRYTAGISLAMLKPYYLKLVHTDYSQPEPRNFLTEEKYNTTNADTFLRNNNILGGTKWSKGLGETKLIPGIFAEASFAIEPAAHKGFVQTITVGANGAFYTQSLPIMTEVKAYPWQASLFIGFSLGKRWK